MLAKLMLDPDDLSTRVSIMMLNLVHIDELHVDDEDFKAFRCVTHSLSKQSNRANASQYENAGG
jgi:hypothetical protein